MTCRPPGSIALGSLVIAVSRQTDGPRSGFAGIDHLVIRWLVKLMPTTPSLGFSKRSQHHVLPVERSITHEIRDANDASDVANNRCWLQHREPVAKLNDLVVDIGVNREDWLTCHTKANLLSGRVAR